MPFKRQKSNVSPHYHDTRTLLRKYRDVIWNLEVSDLDLQEEFKAEYGLSTDALFVDSEVNKGGNRLESYARALERSKKMMQIIDTAIDLMRRKHKKGEFYYWILYYAYLSPQQCENTLAEIESERASLTYSDIDDSVGGHVSYNAFQLISMYSAYQGEDDYTKISLADLSAQVQAHRTEYYTYTTSEEVRTEPVQKEVRGQTITVQEDHTYTVFTLSYVGDDYFADTVWQLDDKQKSCADAYAHNLTVYLHEIEEHEGITILGQINDALIDDTSPAPSGGFGNPFNDPNWEQHITSFFGKREDVGIPGKDTTNHNGLDIAYPYGTPILAVEGGTVIKSGYHVSYGNYLVINHGGGYCTLYAHCSQLLAQVGDTVNKYDTIAKVGATGDVTGNHLHICVIIDGVYVNPKGYLH